MDNLREVFVGEIEARIASRKRVELIYRILQLSLMIIIAGCGFLTAAAGQAETKSTWVSTSKSLLIFGLLSAICAIVNQVLDPGAKHLYHKSVKKALQYIRGQVKFGDMPVKDAENLNAVAITNPESVLGKLPSAPTGTMNPPQ